MRGTCRPETSVDALNPSFQKITHLVSRAGGGSIFSSLSTTALMVVRVGTLMVYQASSLPQKETSAFRSGLGQSM